ncbi:MAG: hypothetical protein JXR76_04350 [Deltaproteobacteria bacterium]|nr:hypothetical protein [Deltaproteobacteria bacterium]
MNNLLALLLGILPALPARRKRPRRPNVTLGLHVNWSYDNNCNCAHLD